MKHKDIKKFREYWAFLNKNADDAFHNLPYDEANSKVFADWLQDHNDARHLIARAAHTSSPYRVHSDSVGLGWRGSMLDSTPATAYVDNAHSSVDLMRHFDPLEPGETKHRPVLLWTAHIPGTVSTTRIRRTARLLVTPTAAQLHEFIDSLPTPRQRTEWRKVADDNGWKRPEDPAKLARGMVGEKNVALGPANRAAGSANHEKRLELARRVLREAGVTPASVRSVLAHDGKQSIPAIAVVGRVANEQHALYAGSWVGLTTQTPRIVVFHPGEGQDTLHVIDSPHPAAHVTDYARRSGLSGFATEESAGGTRLYAVNVPDAEQLARGLDARHSRIPGRADRIGSGEGAGSGTGRPGQAAARAAYRTVIRDAERAALGS